MTADPTATAVAARLSIGCGVVTLVAGLAVISVTESVPLAVQLLPFAISVVVLGLPHGAVDHLVIPRVRDDRVTWHFLLAFGVGYLALAGLYLVGWFSAPVVAFAGFVLLTIAHWGQGDVYVLRELYGGRHLENRLHRAFTGVVRGGIPMVVPLVAFPAAYERVATATVGLFDPGAEPVLEPAFDPAVHRWLVVVGCGLVTLSLAWGLLRGGPTRAWLLEAGETVGLIAFFALVPPILAVGLYFAGWHSVRHVLRTILLSDRGADALARGAVPVACWQFFRDATPLTVGGLVVLVVLAVSIPVAPTAPLESLGVYLVCLAILTLPHTIVVTVLDYEQGVWI